MKLGDVFAESWAMVRSQRAASLLTAMVVAALCVTVLFTAGRTNASQQQILETIESKASRAIIIRLEPAAEVNLDVISRVVTIQGLEWVGVLGPTQDVHNPLLGSTRPVAARQIIAYSQQELATNSQSPGSSQQNQGNQYNQANQQSGPASVLQPDRIIKHAVFTPNGDAASAQLAITTPAGAAALGLIDGSGYVEGKEVHATITGVEPLADHLQFLDPIVLLPVPEQEAFLSSPAAFVIAVPQETQAVPATAEAIKSLLAAVDPQSVSVETSAQLHELSALVEGQLSETYRALVVGVFSVLVLIVAALLYGLVMIRRRDFGRRRALGAKRSLIVGLIMLNTVMVASGAAMVGSLAALIALTVSGSPLPSPQFVIATGFLAVIAAVVGAIIPGVIASRRDPLVELRVP